MSTTISGKVKPKISKADLQSAMETITELNKKMEILKEDLKDKLAELKAKGVNVEVLKKVCLIQEAEYYMDFCDYWRIYEDTE